MKNLSPLKTIIFTIIAIATIYFFVMPRITGLRVAQDRVTLLNMELERVNTVNNLLQVHTATINSISISDRQRLNNFLPSSIDPVVLMKQLVSYADQVGVEITEVSLDVVDGAVRTSEFDDVAVETSYRPFNIKLGVLGRYSSIMSFLDVIGTAPFIIQINNMDLSVPEGDRIAGDLQLQVFYYQPNSNNREIDEDDYPLEDIM